MHYISSCAPLRSFFLRILQTPPEIQENLNKNKDKKSLLKSFYFLFPLLLHSFLEFKEKSKP